MFDLVFLLIYNDMINIEIFIISNLKYHFVNLIV